MALLLLSLILGLSMLSYEADALSKNLLKLQESSTRSPHLKRVLPTLDGDFDCVEIYKQPAFQHPLLKNHKIQSRPSYSGNAFETRKITGGCPMGKVPIHKRKMSQQMTNTSKSQTEDFGQYSQSYPSHHFATLDTTQSVTYRGASADIGLYNLSLQDDQYSLSQIWLQSGPLSQLNIIKVGTAVYPYYYGDRAPRLIGFWTADNYNKTGCFDTQCPGFVQVHPRFAFGSGFTPQSVVGSDEKFSVNIRVKQDPLTGHWWLHLGDVDADVGYWPKELFSHLREGSSLVRFGGESYTYNNVVSPPMGSGELPKILDNSGFFALLKIVDSNYNEDDIKRDEMKTYIDTGLDCYNLLYEGYQGHDYRQTFLFGGPGGKCGV